MTRAIRGVRQVSQGETVRMRLAACPAAVARAAEACKLGGWV